MSLADWRKNSWLAEHASSKEEIAALLAIVDRDLANAEADGLSADWRLAIAYNAALQAATAALADGRLLILSAFRAAEKLITADLAIRRNEFVAALADEVWIARITPGGQMDRLTQRPGSRQE